MGGGYMIGSTSQEKNDVFQSFLGTYAGCTDVAE